MASTTSASPPTVVEVFRTSLKPQEHKPRSTSVSVWLSAQWRPIIAEFISTAMLVLFGCMSSIPIKGIISPSPLYTPLGFGLTVMFNVQIFGHISGAYMNPAVTLAAVISGTISIALGICFFFAQFLGATLGYGILVGLAPIDIRMAGVCVTQPHADLDGFQAVGIEMILTCTLCFVCCALWDPVNNNMQDSAPIKFGLTVVGLSIAGSPLTGASSNPARSFAPVLWTGMWEYNWVYWVGPFMGATVTAVFYKFIFRQNVKNVS